MNKKQIASLVVAATVVHSTIVQASPQQDSTKNNSSDVKNDDATLAKTSKKAKVNVSSYLNIRSGMSTESSIIGHLYANEEVNINYINGDWANITYNTENSNTKTGFVAVKYLTITEAPVNSPTSSNNQTGSSKKAKIQSDSNVYVHTEMSNDSSYIGYVYPKEEVSVNYINDNWANITYSLDNGGTKTGFVSKDLLNFGVSNINTTATVIEKSLRVYNDLNEESGLVGYVFNNEDIKLNFTQGDWSNITYNVFSGGTKTGFVKNSGIQIKGQNSNTNSSNSTNNVIKKGKVINVSSSLRVRQAADTNSLVTGYLSPDSTFDIISKEGSWYKISFDTYSTKRTGYVFQDYVKEFFEQIQDSVLGLRMVEYSKRFIGVPYLWGGTTPNGFDCSGLVQYVYREFGIRIGRTTWDQIKEGKRVELSAMEPGDLIFFGPKSDPNNPTHVGMYIGNGKFIQAPKPGDFIKISDLSTFNMHTIQANRYIKK